GKPSADLSGGIVLFNDCLHCCWSGRLFLGISVTKFLVKIQIVSQRSHEESFYVTAFLVQQSSGPVGIEPQRCMDVVQLGELAGVMLQSLFLDFNNLVNSNQAVR